MLTRTPCPSHSRCSTSSATSSERRGAAPPPHPPPLGVSAGERDQPGGGGGDRHTERQHGPVAQRREPVALDGPEQNDKKLGIGRRLEVGWRSGVVRRERRMPAITSAMTWPPSA